MDWHLKQRTASFGHMLFCAGAIIFGKDSQNIDFHCPRHKTCFFYLLVQILCYNVILDDDHRSTHPPTHAACP